LLLADAKSPALTQLSVTLDQSGYTMKCSFLSTDHMAFMTTHGLHPASYTRFWIAEVSALDLHLSSVFCYDTFQPYQFMSCPTVKTGELQIFCSYYPSVEGHWDLIHLTKKDVLENIINYKLK
jgi:predicted amidohydrolase